MLPTGINVQFPAKIHWQGKVMALAPYFVGYMMKIFRATNISLHLEVTEK